MSQLKFRYKAVDRAGGSVNGEALAASRVEAYRQLITQGLTPTSIAEERSSIKRGGRGGVRQKDIAHFAQQMAVLIGARIPLADGLRSIADQESNRRFQDVLRSIATRVEAGEQFGLAMGQHAEIFGDVFLETIRSAEKTGNLTKVLEYLAEMLERGQETRQQVRSALMYPMCVVGALGLALAFLIGVIVPKFGRMYEARGMELPTLTKVLVAIGDSMHDYWWVYLVGVGAAGYGIRQMMRTASGRVALDTLMHKVPVVGSLLTGAAVSRFARVFGLSISSGIGLIEAIEMAGRASGRAMLQKDTERMIEQVRAGGRLSVVLEACTYLPKFAKRMIAAGEESAELPKMCGVVARQYDRETSASAKNLATVIEPVLVVAIAAVVALVALAVFLPMWNMVKLLG